MGHHLTINGWKKMAVHIGKTCMNSYFIHLGAVQKHSI